MILHSVYFTLVKEIDAKAFESFVEDTRSFGKNIPNIEYLQVGVAMPEANREVHDKDFEVALVSAFPNEEALDHYLNHPDHLAYCARNEKIWTKLRVFDARN